MQKRSDTVTAIRRKVSFCQVQMNTHNITPRSSNSKLYQWWALAQPTTRDKIRGSIPVKMIDWKQKNNVNLERDEVTPEMYGTYQNLVTSPGCSSVDLPGG